jgi:hypothetical protein
MFSRIKRWLVTKLTANTPLVWTIYGNLPSDILQYEFTWDDQENYLKMVEIYRLNGTVVKESAHVYVKKGFEANFLT